MFMKKVLVVTLALVALIGGCQTTPTQTPSESQVSNLRKRKHPYVESDFAWFREKGTGVVEGEAFARTRGGDLRLAAGLPVWLVPATSYTTEWIFTRIADVELEPDGVEMPKMTCIAGSKGDFRFENVPVGIYYVFCEIQWSALGDPVGVKLYKAIKVNNDTTKIILSK